MVKDGNYTLGGEQKVAHTDVALPCRTSETYTMLQTNVTSWNTFKKSMSQRSNV